MYYVLKDEYEFCGYQKLPYVLKNNNNGSTLAISDGMHKMLSLCEGKVNFDLPIFTDKELKILEFAKKHNLIRERKDENDVRNINYTYYDNRYIRSLHILLTGKCNFKCKHCDMSASSKDAFELPYEKICYIIDEIKKSGIFSVSLSGGECLIRKDFFDILDRFLENGIHIRELYTNGWLVDDKLLDELEKRNIRPIFSISFDGIGWHDYLRGVEGAEKRVDETFRLLHKRGYTINVELCLFGKNKNIIFESIKYLQEVGVSSVKINPVARVGEWTKQKEDDDISLEDAYQVLVDLVKKYVDAKLSIYVSLLGFSFDEKGKVRFFSDNNVKCSDYKNICPCTHERLQGCITERGVLVPCVSMARFDTKIKFPNILDKGLRACLTDSVYMDYINISVATIFEHNPKCKDCEYKELCLGGCRAGAMVTTNDTYGVDERTCELFKKGYYEKIKKVILDK